MPVTAEGVIVSGGRTGSRTARIRGETIHVPLPPEGQRRRLVWPDIEPIYRSLAKKTGASFATDFAVLAMVFVDTGHVFHPRSIARARRRASKRGVIESKPIRPNRKAGAHRTVNGTVRVRFPDVAELRAARWREKIEARKRRQLARAARERARELVQVRPNESPRERARADGEPLPKLLDAQAHVRTALAAIQGVELAPMPRRQEVRTEAAHGADVVRAEVARQLDALRATDLEDDPPDE